jgi:hypothetical protein
MSVFIAGYGSSVKLLKKIWESKQPTATARNNALFSELEESKSETCVQTYIDYFEGRCIKCVLRNDDDNNDERGEIGDGALRDGN